MLLGDLNLGPPSVSAVLSALDGTWSQLEVPAAFPADEPAHAIDHVLVRGVEAKAAPGWHRPVVSDHRPVVVDLL